jgi:hypothetical protein
MSDGNDDDYAFYLSSAALDLGAIGTHWGGGCMASRAGLDTVNDSKIF